jgi:hypothetical protein
VFKNGLANGGTGRQLVDGAGEERVDSWLTVLEKNTDYIELSMQSQFNKRGLL